MRLLQFYILLLLALGLASCATLPEQPIALNQFLSLQDRAARLASIQTWNIKGVMAIRTNAGSEGGSAHLEWQQRQQRYTLMLWGPLGADAIKITGQPGHVSLETANGKKFSASSPELLLVQQTGWQLPMTSLYYWIRGLPVPGLPARKQLDAYHHLVSLHQQGWTVDYLRYGAVNQVDVPSKISLQNWRLQVKIIINQWQF